MPKNTELLIARDKHVRTRYRQHCKQKPFWKREAILVLLSKEVFLSPVTICKILQAGNIDAPTAPTVSKYSKATAAA